jgi:cell division FtsZ-interacting protein ZapD
MVATDDVVKELQKELARERRRAQRWRMIAIIRREQLMLTLNQMENIIGDLIADEDECEREALIQGLFNTLRIN